MGLPFLPGYVKSGSQDALPAERLRRGRRQGWLVRKLHLEPLEARTLPSFIASLNYDAGTNSYSVALGDFNRDGAPDLAAANYTGPNGTVSVLLGRGDGSFSPPTAYSAGASPVAVVAGDFNADEIFDLAVANAGSGNVSVLLGKGDGSFAPAVHYAVGGNPSSLAVGDFNGDGHLDLVAVSPGVSVLLGNGDGSFQSALNHALLGFTVVVGDFNRDGHADLALGYRFSVSVALGNGDGSFQAASSRALDGWVGAPAVGDLNGDGQPDLAVALSICDQGCDGVTAVLLGTGDGSFQAPRYYGLGFGYSSSRSVAIADFDGDSVPDLAAGVVWDDGSEVSVLRGHGDGTFHLVRSYAVAGESSLAAGDLNNDGYLDLVSGATPTGRLVSVLIGLVGGSFLTAPTYGVGWDPRFIAVGDFNGDGQRDLVTTNYARDTVSVLLGAGDGSFQPARNYVAGSGPYAVAVGDFNGDGNQDLAVTIWGHDWVAVLLGNGDGTFRAARNFFVGRYPVSVAVGDFNSDGRLDLAVGAGSGISVLLGNGDGSFRGALVAGSYVGSVAVGDFNGDGRPDLAVPAGLDGVSVLLGNGDGTFQRGINYASGTRTWDVAVGDFNEDGHLDLAANYYVLLGNGDGSFQAPVTHAIAWAIQVGDFNGDGHLDLASPGNLLLGRGDGTLEIAAWFNAGSGSLRGAAGDFNGDGYLDWAVANYGSYDVSILLNDGNWPTSPGGGSGPFSPTGKRPTGKLESAAAVALSASPKQPAIPEMNPVTTALPAGTRLPPELAPVDRFFAASTWKDHGDVALLRSGRALWNWLDEAWAGAFRTPFGDA